MVLNGARQPRAGRPRFVVRVACLVRDFAAAERGVTAVEFGMVGAPFLFMLFAILEIALVFWSTQVLETAVANASRQIYTGQFQSDSANANKTSAELAAAFKQKLCANITALFKCSDVFVDIRNLSSFSSAAPPPVVVAGRFNAAAFGYENVGQRQIALVTAAMEYPTFLPLLTGSGSLSNGNRVIMATAAFKTEPYSF